MSLTIQEKDLVRTIISEKISILGNPDVISQIMSDFSVLSDEEIRQKISDYKEEKLTELTNLSNDLAQQKSNVDAEINNLKI